MVAEAKPIIVNTCGKFDGTTAGRIAYSGCGFVKIFVVNINETAGQKAKVAMSGCICKSVMKVLG